MYIINMMHAFTAALKCITSLLISEECKVVQIAENEVETLENDPVLSHPVQCE